MNPLRASLVLSRSLRTAGLAGRVMPPGVNCSLEPSQNQTNSQLAASGGAANGNALTMDDVAGITESLRSLVTDRDARAGMSRAGDASGVRVANREEDNEQSREETSDVSETGTRFLSFGSSKRSPDDSWKAEPDGTQPRGWSNSPASGTNDQQRGNTWSTAASSAQHDADKGASSGQSPNWKTERKSERLVVDRVYVGNLSFQATADDVASLFSPCGQIHRILLQQQPGEERRHRGFCFVQFAGTDQEVEEAARKAVAELNGWELMGRVLRVEEDDWRRRFVPGQAQREGGGERGGKGEE